MKDLKKISEIVERSCVHDEGCDPDWVINNILALFKKRDKKLVKKIKKLRMKDRAKHWKDEGDYNHGLSLGFNMGKEESLDNVLELIKE